MGAPSVRATVPASARTTHQRPTGNTPPDQSEEHPCHRTRTTRSPAPISRRSSAVRSTHTVATDAAGRQPERQHQASPRSSCRGARRVRRRRHRRRCQPGASKSSHEAACRPCLGTTACSGNPHVRGQGLRPDFVHREWNADAQLQHRSVGDSHVVTAAPRAVSWGLGGLEGGGWPDRLRPRLPFVAGLPACRGTQVTVESRRGSRDRGPRATPLMADVFVSYSRRDAEFVHRLTDAISTRGRREVWLDTWGILIMAGRSPRRSSARSSSRTPSCS